MLKSCAHGCNLKRIACQGATDAAHVEVGTVYPTKDVRAALLVDSFLGKHFALLGSTGTGKSTAVRALAALLVVARLNAATMV